MRNKERNSNFEEEYRRIYQVAHDTIETGLKEEGYETVCWI
jgi:hypothetical protein